MSVDFGASVNSLVQWGFLLLILILFVGFSTRSSRRQRESVAQMQASLQVGDEVITTSGIYGSIGQLAESRVGLEIAPGIVIEVARQAIARKVEDAELGRESDEPIDPDDVSEASDE